MNMNEKVGSDYEFGGLRVTMSEGLGVTMSERDGSDY